MVTRRFAHTPPVSTLKKLHPMHPNRTFQPLPAPTGKAPYRLNLEDVLPADKMDSIRGAKKVVFHTTGDTGGINAPAAQQIVSMHMEYDMNSHQKGEKPAFFYHLGDVVYYNGEAENYYPQFYEPYMHYDAPIFAIPGNHDGDLPMGQSDSLLAFKNNFCAPTPLVSADAGDVARQAMTQPNVYWTLQTPYANIIGLYTNVPDGGMLDQDQIDWFHGELRNAARNKALIIAMHHPIYSADTHHSGSVYMHTLLTTAIKETNRIPDMVLAGHVHNYQRFTQKASDVQGERDIPYIVAGAGGYFHLHYEQQQDNGRPMDFHHSFPEDHVTLECFRDNRHGFLRLEVSESEIKGTYLTVPRPQEDWRAPAEVFDAFNLDLSTHRVQTLESIAASVR